jgi:hypothetical protein
MPSVLRETNGGPAGAAHRAQDQQSHHRPLSARPDEQAPVALAVDDPLRGPRWFETDPRYSEKGDGLVPPWNRSFQVAEPALLLVGGKALG